MKGQRVCCAMVWICLRVAGCCSSTKSDSSRWTAIASPTGRLARRPSAAASMTCAPGAKREAAHRALDQGGGVLRHDAEMIAGAVAHAIGQQHFDVPRAAPRGVGRLCSSRFASTRMGSAPVPPMMGLTGGLSTAWTW